MPINPDQFKSFDAASYDAVADRFDYWTDRVASGLAKDVVALSCLQPGERILDVGTGSGLVARTATIGEITGIDLSEGMLRKAISKIPPGRAMQFRKMDAEHLEFEPATFDVALSLFAILHFPHPDVALQEIRRVVKPGGRVVLGVGSSTPLSWAGLVSLGKRFRQRGKDMTAPPAFLQAAKHESVAAHIREPLHMLMRDAGFQNIRNHWRPYTHQIGTSAEFWDLHTTLSSVERKRMESASPEEVEQARGIFCASCDAFLEKGGRLIYRNAAMIVSAVSP